MQMHLNIYLFPIFLGIRFCHTRKEKVRSQMKKTLIIVSAIVAVIGLASVATVLSLRKDLTGIFDLVDEDGESLTGF